MHSMPLQTRIPDPLLRNLGACSRHVGNPDAYVAAAADAAGAARAAPADATRAAAAPAGAVRAATAPAGAADAADAAANHAESYVCLFWNEDAEYGYVAEHGYVAKHGYVAEYGYAGYVSISSISVPRCQWSKHARRIFEYEPKYESSELEHESNERKRESDECNESVVRISRTAIWRPWELD